MAANALLLKLLMLLLIMLLSAYSLPTTTSDDDTQEEVVTFPPSYWGDPAPNAYLQALTPYSTVWNGEPVTEPKTGGNVREEEENPVDNEESTVTAQAATAADKKQAIRTTSTESVKDTKKQRKHKVGKNSTTQHRTKYMKKLSSNTTLTAATATADATTTAATTTTTTTVPAAAAVATAVENADEVKKGTDVNSHVFASLKELENDVTEFRDAMGSVAENVIEDRLDNTNDKKGEGVLARRSNRIKEAILKSRLRKEKFENQLLDFFTNYLCSVDCK